MKGAAKAGRRHRARGAAKAAKRRGASRVDQLIEAAVVDCYNESEAVAGFHAMIEGHLATPFVTEVLGVEVAVQGVELTAEEGIVAVCRRGHFRQVVPLLHLRLPKPLPEGGDWIEAYGRWVEGR